jgi:branched-chain amino acid transport system permease protein
MWAFRALTAEQTPAQAFVWALAIIVVCIFPIVVNNSRFIDTGISYAIFAICLFGLALLFGQTNFLSIAHSALLGVGAYTAAIILNELGIGFWAGLPICALVAGVSAAILGYPSIRIGGYHFVIVTFAACELFVLTVKNIGGDNSRNAITGGAQGLDIDSPVSPVLGQTLDIVAELGPFYYLTVAFLGLTILLCAIIIRSNWGRTFRAIRENEMLAQAVGINANRWKIWAFTISGMFAGVAGAFYAYKLRHIYPDVFDSFFGVELAMMILIGGSRNLMGPLVGAIIVGFLPEVLNEIGIGLSPYEKQIMFGLILVAVIVLLPQGLAVGVGEMYGKIKRKLIASYGSATRT